MTFQTEDKARLRRQRAEHAIQLALDSRWEEAVAANRAILTTFPNDVEAWNRLGKALSELSRYDEAREAYRKSHSLDSTNTIARRNLERLASLAGASSAGAEPQQRLDPQLFIEETGKTGVTALNDVDAEVLSRMTAGDQVQLKVGGTTLIVETMRGEYLGQVEPRLGLRLTKLMEGGNEYVSAITSLNDSGCRIIIRETYQHPSQVGRPSFPAVGAEGVRPYTKESLLRYGLEEDEEAEEEAGEEWEGEAGGGGDAEASSGDMDLEGYQRIAEGSDKDDEYEE